MWGDMYTKVWQCGHYLIPKTPNAHWLHDKALDEYLMDSMAGQVRAKATLYLVYM